MTEFLEIAVFDLIFRGFATLYLAVAVVDLLQWIPWTKLKKDDWGKDAKKRVLDGKPFNCVLCMFFWMAFPARFVPSQLVFIPALAGMALFLYKIMNRSEVFGV